jgi:hypothetical protein
MADTATAARRRTSRTAGPGTGPPVADDGCGAASPAARNFLTADLKTARLAISAGRCLFRGYRAWTHQRAAKPD